MTEAEQKIVKAEPASTVLMVRDGEQGLEVFMVVRHPKIEFASGALVFPGGRVDPEDSDAPLIARCAGRDNFDIETLALRVAAIRETFEEAGILLARRAGESDLITGADFDAVYKKYRMALHGGDITMLEIAEAEDLELACDLLIPFAHWITPKQIRKRFDTHFFVVAAPKAQTAVHDGSESVDSIWIRPNDAVAEGEAGRQSVMFPTRLNLGKLERSGAVDRVLSDAAAQPVVTVLPQAEKLENGGRRMHIPIEAGYGASVFVVDYAGS
ncbi:MAG: 8-oxo-dGTP pyrophosphatase MutT (NUDIX family) [Alphaproteobacteria bacterium]|jgi:8-oxo-dGTP pyrophosphatase MutT (NUDIX family)